MKTKRGQPATHERIESAIRFLFAKDKMIEELYEEYWKETNKEKKDQLEIKIVLLERMTVGDHWKKKKKSASK